MKKSPLNFIGGMIGNAAASLSGGSNNSNNRFQSIMGGLFGNNPANLAAQSLMAREQSQQVPVNPGFNRDPNNSTQQSGSIVSQADMNMSQNRNGGAGVLTQGMHEMNSNMPIVSRKPGFTTSNDMSKPAYNPNANFSNATTMAGNSVFGTQEQRQASVDPVQDLNIDQTGMNSLYGGPGLS